MHLIKYIGQFGRFCKFNVAHFLISALLFKIAVLRIALVSKYVWNIGETDSIKYLDETIHLKLYPDKLMWPHQLR